MRKLFLSVLPVVLVLLSLFTILSCDKGEPEVKEQGVSLFFAVAEQVSIGIDKVPLSKSINDVQISNLWVLQFDSSDKLVNKVFINSSVSASTLVSLKSNDDQGHVYKLRFVANTSEELFRNASDGDGSYDLSTFENLTIPTSTGVTADRIPMVGDIDVAVSSATREIGSSANPIPMYRLYAKVVLKYGVARHLRPSIPTNIINLRINQVNLVGVPKNISLTREVASDATSIDPGELKTMNFYPSGSFPGDEGNNLILYLPQNVGGLGTSSDYKDAGGTASPANLAYIEFTTTYYEGTERVVTFKVYLGNNVTDNYNVLSNSLYNLDVKINDVDFSNPTISVI